MKVSNVSFGVGYYLKKQKITQAGKCPIYARISVNGKRIEISSKQSVELSNWNSNKGLAKGSRSEISNLNRYLDQFKGRIIEIYQELSATGQQITVELIKSKFMGDDQNDYTIRKLIDYHNEIETENLEKGTLKNYYTTQKYLLAFIKHQFHTRDKFLSELNYKFIIDLEIFLRRVKNNNGELSMANNGVMKHLERLCKMVNLAVKLEWLERNPFYSYQLKFEKIQRDYLTALELVEIEEKSITVLRLQTIRDLFVFSCYTGLAYIDVFNLKSAHIVEVAKGEFWIKTTRQKTKTIVTVPLLPKALKIIDKYRKHPQATADCKLLPVVSNQKLNAYLKEIADICGITKTLTFHIARHTFATTVTLTNGVPIETVSRMLGHKKISTTQIYSRVVDSKMADDMAALSKKLGV